MKRRDEWRAAVYHRLHLLVPFASHRLTRGAWRAFVRIFWLLYFAFVLLVLVLRYSILPNIENYRSSIEQLASKGLGQDVRIGRIEASWEGINPDLALIDVRVSDAEGRPALAFSRIEAILSWWSVPTWQLKLRLLRIEAPTLNLRRDARNRFFIAGIPLSQEQSEGDISGWVLAQRRIRINGATLVWEDELRQAPPLVLEDLNFALDNDGRRHRFGLTALPPVALASKIDLRGDFQGDDIEQVGLWSGQAYAEIDYADLAVWRQWVDYPVALPHGRGALRTWIGFGEGRLYEITADIALQDVRLRFSSDLPALELDHMSGRLRTRFPVAGFEVQGRQIELATRARVSERAEGAIRIEPMNFNVEWIPDGQTSTGRGSATASRIDIGALVRLSDYLPFDGRTRQLLTDYAPTGRVDNLSARWSGSSERLDSYALEAGFDELGLTAQGYFPGFSGLRGALEFTEKGGAATLNAHKASVDLPSVFPESLIILDTLAAQARWKLQGGVLDAELTGVEFSGPDAAGTAQGTYRNTGTGPGSIDLGAALTRADARAVWRYMPHVVNANTRHWLRDSLLGGGASEARLVLKGDLEYFPFLDGSQGQFLVTVKAEDVTLDYGTGWPIISGIFGDLRFEGNGMTVDARKGSILGAQLYETQAVIPDFDAPVSHLLINGKAQGPTSEFLRFIDQSPVAERIDRFTDDMRASGDGLLDLKLSIPLEEARLKDSRIDGAFRFANNEVVVDAALPPLRQVNGTIRFSGSDLRIPEINAALFGGPLRIRGGSQKDGRVLIAVTGSIASESLRRLADTPLLAGLTGAIDYRGEVHVAGRNAELVVESSLVGLGSNLPEPFGKLPGDPLPLRFERKILPSAPSAKGPVPRDQIRLSLGATVMSELVRRNEGSGHVAERGVLAIGRPPVLPESGLAVVWKAERLDLDAWRKILAPPPGPASRAGDSPVTSFPSLALSLYAGNLKGFGYHLSEVDLNATSSEALWKFRLNSRQAQGDLVWDGSGSGKLTARLRRLSIDPSSDSPDSSASVQNNGVDTLPAIDLVAEDFLFGKRSLGRVEVLASNEGTLWRLDRVEIGGSDGRLAGSGEWRRAAGRNSTQLAFHIDSDDVGKLLERMGYPGTIRGGKAQLDGSLGWNSTPIDLEFSSLNGTLALEVGKGQFLKLDPGAAGKLLGLISLQGLPRRITLDFKDVFSDGFAFDSIASKLDVQNGVMRTERLQIDGPSARVVMRGEVDLRRETQRLDVNVQPELGGTAALGVALVNPVAGVATWVAHKLLQNPLNHVFGFDYHVTGTWDDPKVEKVTRMDASPVSPRLPTISPTTGVADDPAKK